MTDDGRPLHGTDERRREPRGDDRTLRLEAPEIPGQQADDPEAAGGRLDVGSGGVTVASGGYDLSAVRRWLATGRNGGGWDGTGRALGEALRDAMEDDRAKHQILSALPECAALPALVERRRGSLRFGDFAFEIEGGARSA